MSKDKKQTPAAPDDPKTEKAGDAAENIKDEVNAQPNQQADTEVNDEANTESETEGKKADKKAAKADAGKEAKLSPEQEIAQLNDKYLRLCAEYDNFRKRSIKERDSLYGDVKADTLKKFLPVYDNLVRALAQSTEDEAYRKGVEMIMAQFNATLEKLGVTEIECLGKPFDPAFHNAVMHEEDESKGEGEIVEVFQKGFIMGDKVLRFAMVKVAN